MRPFAATVRVIYGDTDQMGVVYYGNYLRYFEVGRCEWLRAHGHTYREFEAGGHLLPVIEAQLRYRAPARYDDLLAIEVRPTVARSASVKFSYAVRRGEELLVEGHTTHACVGRDGKPRRFPAAIAELLRHSTAGSHG
jgi:acyl-CoA thioester hydrolase